LKFRLTDLQLKCRPACPPKL